MKISTHISAFISFKTVNVKAHAFGECVSLCFVNIPNCKIIGDMAFIRCYSLRFINCKNVEEIGVKAFGECQSVTKYVFNAKCVGSEAFYSNYSLSSIEFGYLE
jgi:hypothetical protein